MPGSMHEGCLRSLLGALLACVRRDPQARQDGASYPKPSEAVALAYACMQLRIDTGV